MTLERIDQQLHRDNHWRGELHHTRKDGSQILVASRWALDRDQGGNRKCVLETNNDITRQKQDDLALRESQERLRLLANDLENRVRVRTHQLEQRNVEALQQSEQLRELSNRLQHTQDEERRRIARDLHDSAGQFVTALGMNLTRISKRANQDPETDKDLKESREIVEQLSKEIRTLSYLLHPPLLDEIGLSQAISWYTEGLAQRSGLKFQVCIEEGFGRVADDLEVAIFRIIQESLTNVHRHSGSKTAVIRLSRNPQIISLEIEDHGSGISKDKLAGMSQRSGVGMTGMRERVRYLKGDMNVESSSSGTKVCVTLPMRANSKMLKAQ